ncbi:type IV pilus assembly protein PilX [Ectothiorhodospira magna]|uniref:Type IV pilus assembly protein PilX n=1 Tax=Ectothiorhodospira magna TaxID=867345 RepID=A0A1H9B8H5_9GAMM|nr:PilX N-terminal domain-containing pilus assembly protein [Ectothiorhodospira magna]SEP85115.1 type IV pilus assembly protein PilX [Ectothiorhodospira magna]
MARLPSSLLNRIMPGDSLRIRPPQKQRGTALVISLIFLLMMTILGVNAMRDTTLQERMVGNMQDRNMAFQASEAVLRVGEAWIRNQEALDDDDLGQALSDPAAWDGKNPTGTMPMEELAEDPVFHVGKPRIILNDPADPAGGVHAIYTVVSRGVGRSENTVVIIRTHFRP